MAQIEELIYQRLIQDTELSALLARFQDMPAVFEMQAPSDVDAGWQRGAQYPRIVYTVDKQWNPERKVSGTLGMDIFTKATQETGPEVVEARVRALLSNTFFKPDNEPTMAFVWDQTSAFQEEHNDVLIIGLTITFDMLAFPVQTTEEPDPIAALTSWTAAQYPAAYLFNTIGSDIWQPTAGQPAIYWRITGLRIDEQTNAVTWLEATINGHIFTPEPGEALKITRSITEKLALDGKIYLGDGSPMFIRAIAADTNRNPLRDGQITITARYGVLKTYPVYELLNNLNVTGAI